MIRIKGRYRNQGVELTQPLELPEGAEVEGIIFSAEDLEKEGWTQLAMERLEAVWDNPEDAIYDDWKKLYGV